MAHRARLVKRDDAPRQNKRTNVVASNRNVASGIAMLKEKPKRKCQQHLDFPGGHPSRYYRDPTLLNFGDLTGSGAFSVV